MYARILARSQHLFSGLVRKHQVGVHGVLGRTLSSRGAMGGAWREACSLIVTGNVLESEHGYDYKVLLLQRNTRSRFAPGNFVFPGGAVDPEDFSNDWCDVFNDVMGMTLHDAASQLLVTGHRPPIMNTDHGTKVPAEIGLRICAIRECFEESGLLLVRPSGVISNPVYYTSLVDNSIPEQVLRYYQEEVGKDAKVFREFCKKYRVVPDVWGLKEWNDWLTPITSSPTTSGKKPRRFDTIFYICAVDKAVTPVKDNGEIISTKWVQPNLILSDKVNDMKLWFPQLYQFAALANFPSQKLLAEFFTQRAPLGVEVWMPHIILCRDGMISPLPGDDLYPTNPDYEGNSPLQTDDRNAEEILKDSQHFHHMFRSNSGMQYIRCNIDPKFGHRRILNFEIRKNKSKV